MARRCQVTTAPLWEVLRFLAEGRSTFGAAARKSWRLYHKKITGASGKCHTHPYNENEKVDLRRRIGTVNLRTRRRFFAGSVFDRRDFATFQRPRIDSFFPEIGAGQSSCFLIHHQRAEQRGAIPGE